ncbi:MAG: FemAB family XrtA/PEP-CTERM system-associated protein [Planctomycetota bacterium]
MSFEGTSAKRIDPADAPPRLRLQGATISVEAVGAMDDPTDRQELQAMVRRAAASPSARVGHEMHPDWLAVLSDGLRHRPRGLAARRPDGGLAGWMPLVEVKSRLFGKHLSSLPYLNRAGLVAETDEARDALLDAACDTADRLDARQLLVRFDGEAPDHPAWTGRRDDKPRLLLDLPGDASSLWGAIAAKVRNQVRKGGRQPLEFAFGGEELLAGFYDVFAENMRDLGTPVYPRGLFASILRRFPEEAELVTVRLGRECVGGALLVHDAWAGSRTTQVPSASCLRKTNPLSVNMAMYWRLLERAIERGARTFDFGRSTVGSGPYRFKRQWGAWPRATAWASVVRRGGEEDLRPDGLKHRRRVEAWKKLPLRLTRAMGPAIVRGVP